MASSKIRTSKPSNIYMNTFTAEVGLMNTLKAHSLSSNINKKKKKNKPPQKSLLAGTVEGTISVVTPPTSFLTPEQQEFLNAATFDSMTQNPVYGKHLSEHRKAIAECSSSSSGEKEVRGLPHDVIPAKSKKSGQGIQEMSNNRKLRHDQVLNDFHQRLRDIHKEMQPSIQQASIEFRRSLSSSDVIIDNLITRIEDDTLLVRFNRLELDELWEDIAEQSEIRDRYVTDLIEALMMVERKRGRALEQAVQTVVPKLESVGLLLPLAVRQVVDVEIKAVNIDLLGNRRSHTELRAKLQRADVEREREQRDTWVRCHRQWRVLKREQCIASFTKELDATTLSDPPRRRELLYQLREEQRRRHEARIDLLSAARDLRPPYATLEATRNWVNMFQVLHREEETEQLRLLSELRRHEDEVHTMTCGCMNAHVEELRSSEAFDDSAINEIIENELYPLLVRRRYLASAMLQRIHVTLQRLLGAAREACTLVCRFLESGIQLWSEHSIALEHCSSVTQQHLDETRAQHDAKNQDLEAALDNIMDRMRQDSTEDALGNSLDRALQFLVTIEQAYHEFHVDAKQVILKYPNAVEIAVSDYSEIMLEYACVSTKPLGPKNKGKNRRTIPLPPLKRDILGFGIFSKGDINLNMDSFPGLNECANDSEISRKLSPGQRARDRNLKKTYGAPWDPFEPIEEVSQVTISRGIGCTDNNNHNNNNSSDTGNSETTVFYCNGDLVSILYDEMNIAEDDIRARFPDVVEEVNVSNSNEHMSDNIGISEEYNNDNAEETGDDACPTPVGSDPSTPSRGPTATDVVTTAFQLDAQNHAVLSALEIAEPPLCPDESPAIDELTFDPDFIKELCGSIRHNILVHLIEWRTIVGQRASATVVARLEELNNELDLRLHLHGPRARRAEMDVHHVRAAELLMHQERIKRHEQGVIERLSSIYRHFKTSVEILENAETTHKNELNTHKATLGCCRARDRLDIVVGEIQDRIRKYSQKLDAELSALQNDYVNGISTIKVANDRLSRSFKAFQEGGNFSLDEVNEFRKRIDKIDENVTMVSMELANSHTSTCDARRVELETDTASINATIKLHEEDLALINRLSRVTGATLTNIRSEMHVSTVKSEHLSTTLDKLHTTMRHFRQRKGMRKSISFDDGAAMETSDSVSRATIVLRALEELRQTVYERAFYLNCLRFDFQLENLAEIIEDVCALNLPESTSSGRMILSRSAKNEKVHQISAKLASASKSMTRESSAGRKKASARSAERDKGFNRDISSANAADSNGKQNPGSPTDRSRASTASKKRSVVSPATSIRSSKHTECSDNYDSDIISVTFFDRVSASIDRARHDLINVSNDYYTRKVGREITRPNVIKENKELFLVSVDETLSRLRRQAEQFRESALQNFSVQLAKITTVLMDSIHIVFDDVFSEVHRSAEISRRNAEALLAISQERWETQRNDHSRSLRVSLGHPDNHPKLTSLCLNEKNRGTEAVNGTRHALRSILNVEIQYAETLVTRLVLVTRTLLALLDSFVLSEDIECAKEKPRPKKKSLRRLLREQAKIQAAILEERNQEVNSKDSSVGQTRQLRTWAGLSLTEMQITDWDALGLGEPTVTASAGSKISTEGKSGSALADVNPTVEENQPVNETASPHSTPAIEKENFTDRDAESAKKSRIVPPAIVSPATPSPSRPNRRVRRVTTVATEPLAPSLSDCITSNFTPLHQAVVASRDAAFAHYSKLFNDIVSNASKRAISYAKESDKWQRNWKQQIVLLQKSYLGSSDVGNIA